MSTPGCTCDAENPGFACVAQDHRQILAEDRELRAELAAVTAERDEARAELARVIAAVAAECDAIDAEANALEATLVGRAEAAEAERDRLLAVLEETDENACRIADLMDPRRRDPAAASHVLRTLAALRSLAASPSPGGDTGKEAP